MLIVQTPYQPLKHTMEELTKSNIHHSTLYAEQLFIQCISFLGPPLFLKELMSILRNITVIWSLTFIESGTWMTFYSTKANDYQAPFSVLLYILLLRESMQVEIQGITKQ